MEKATKLRIRGLTPLALSTKRDISKQKIFQSTIIFNMDKSYEPEREIFEQSYFNFFKALEALSKKAEEQCDLMGWHNVAWELRDDISIGWCLLETGHQYLSSLQKNAINDFLKEIEKLPDGIFNIKNTKEGHLQSMNNPRWEPIRRKAKDLIQTLKPVTAKNECFFKKD